ncbi:MAG: hypothetical protein V3W34_14985 [Phycisphaerae bacterium]
MNRLDAFLLAGIKGIAGMMECLDSEVGQEGFELQQVGFPGFEQMAERKGGIQVHVLGMPAEEALQPCGFPTATVRGGDYRAEYGIETFTFMELFGQFTTTVMHLGQDAFFCFQLADFRGDR